MKQILVPADFSGPGQAALQFAADLSERTEARLLVRDYPVAARRDDDALSHEGPLQYWTRTHEQLPIQLERIEAAPAQDLLASCRRENPDLVVLGATGSRIESGVLEEGTAYLARHIECPLVVIEKPARLPLRRVLFVSDFSEPEAAVFQRALSLVGVYEPEIHFLYVKNSQYFNMPLILAKSVMGDFADLAVPLACHSHVTTGGSISQAVSERVQSLDIDLVVLGNQPRSLLYRLLTEDVLARVLRDTDIPVLIVPR